MFYAGFVLRAGADRFVSAVYPESEPWIFMAVMLALAVRAGLGSLRTLGRCAAVTAPVLGAMFLLVFLACVPNMAKDLFSISADKQLPAKMSGFSEFLADKFFAGSSWK